MKRSVTNIFSELNRAVLLEIEAIAKQKQELQDTLDTNKRILEKTAQLKAELDEQQRLIEKEKVIDRQRKASLDVREGKIQAIEERLRGL